MNLSTSQRLLIVFALGASSLSTRATDGEIDNPPVIIINAGHLALEVDDPNSSVALANWISAYGGAVAIDDLSSVAWTHSFEIISDTETLYTFTATDSIGQTASTSASVFIIDNRGPSILLTVDGVPHNPEDGAYVLGTNQRDVPVTYTVSDASGAFASASFEISGNATVTPTPGGLEIDKGKRNASVSLTVEAVDGAGNPTTQTLLIEFAPPGRR